eukprot:4614694-Amphidinium_carterae.3
MFDDPPVEQAERYAIDVAAASGLTPGEQQCAGEEDVLTKALPKSKTKEVCKTVGQVRLSSETAGA